MNTTSSISARVLSRFSIAAFSLALTGCPDEEETPSGGTEGEDSLCKQCRDAYGNQRVAASCKCVDVAAVNTCWANEAACVSYCEGLVDGEYQGYSVQSCLSHDPVGSCTGWNPAAEVTFVTATQTYEIDQDFIEELTDEWGSAPLWTCDNAGFASIPGGFKVINANSGEFLYQVGLRNNDEIQTINGINVKTWAGAEAAFGQYLSGGTVNYLAVVKRGVNNIQLKWKLVP